MHEMNFAKSSLIMQLMMNLLNPIMMENFRSSICEEINEGIKFKLVSTQLASL
jgi:hypothetical protein